MSPIGGIQLTPPYSHCLASGYLYGKTPFVKFGYNGDVDTGAAGETVWAYGGVYAFPSAKMQLEVISSSADDTGAGTGAQKVTIYYLDDAYAEKTKEVTLNGTTAVATVVEDIFRINAFRVTQGTYAAGNIDLRETDDSPIYSRIPALGTQARNSVYTVPAGKTLYLSSFGAGAVGAAAGKGTIITLRTNYSEKAAAAGTIFYPYAEVAVQDGFSEVEFPFPIKLPATTSIICHAVATGDNTFVTTAARGWLE